MLPILKEQFEIRKNKVLDLIESYAKEYAQDLSNLQPYMIERVYMPILRKLWHTIPIELKAVH